MQHERVYAFLHIPVQAASNAVLATMRREYLLEVCRWSIFVNGFDYLCRTFVGWSMFFVSGFEEGPSIIPFSQVYWLYFVLDMILSKL